MLFGGQETLGSWVRLPPAVFSGKKRTPKFWTCRPGQTEPILGHILIQQITSMFRGRIFRGNFGWGVSGVARLVTPTPCLGLPQARDEGIMASPASGQYGGVY